MTSSREVSCIVVYRYVAATLIDVADWPDCGTPAWTALDDADPRKLASLYHAALNWALTQDILQGAEREASQAISLAADWKSIASQKRQGRGSAYIPRKTA